MNLREIIKRDWPGMIVTSVTFGLFGIGLYLVIDSQYAIHNQVVRQELIMEELARNRHEILATRERIEDLQREIKQLHRKDG